MFIPRNSVALPRSLHSQIFMNSFFLDNTRVWLLPKNNMLSTYNTTITYFDFWQWIYTPVSDKQHLRPIFCRLACACLFQAKDACFNPYNAFLSQYTFLSFPFLMKP